MTHLKFIKVDDSYSECKGAPVYLYKSNDGEIFTSLKSLWQYLYLQQLKKELD